MVKQFHTVVIGAGSAGLTVAAGLAGLGKPTALIEARHVGGDCTNVGCVPSKSLIHLANHPSQPAHHALAEVRRKRDALREKETHEFGELPNLTLLFGHARLISPNEVVVQQANGTQQQIQAQQIVIATGARPRTVTIPGLPADRQLTNETIFELPIIPQHLAILGGGVIGMELACAFRKLGSRVSVVSSAPRLMDKLIPEVSETMLAALQQQQIAVYLQAEATRYDQPQSTLWIRHNQVEHALTEVDYVLVAIGRQRNLEGLGLEQLGVQVDPRYGVITNYAGQSTLPSVFAVGDVTRTSAFTHSANAQGRRVVQRIAFPQLPLSKQEPVYPSATFSDPEIATTGLSPAELTQRYHPDVIRRIRVDLTTQTDRGYTDDLQHGWICVDAMRLTGQILAVTIVGPRASEMISLFTLAIQERISLYRLYRLVYPYPTFSSGVQKVADQFLRETLPQLKRELQAYLRYRWAKPTGQLINQPLIKGTHS